MTVDGQVVWDAPCVTGNLSKSYDTPAGLYSLTYKERDRVLRGKKQADGTYEYESPVSYWMPFNGGIGFHDANWRSRFGGDIYKTAGSHGCVNLPPEKAALLYDYVYAGMPVICYN
jgi:lipoprotein-anchoring transpeptidase ErfK/SrfK